MPTRVVTAPALWTFGNSGGGGGSVDPVITGTPGVGNILTCTADPLALFQWTRNGADIVGATNNTYQQQLPDAGQVISCRVYRFTDGVQVPGSVPAPGQFSSWSRRASLAVTASLAPAGAFRMDVDLTSHLDINTNADRSLKDIRVTDANDNLLPFQVRSAGGQQISADGAWSFFNNPHVVYRRYSGVNWMHVGSISSNGSPKVTNFNLDTGAITEAVLRSQMEVDDHDPVGLLVMPDGTLFAFYARHAAEPAGSHLYYRRTTNPADPTSWGTEGDVAGLTTPGANAYPRPVRFANGRIMVFFRNAQDASSYRPTSFIYSDNNGSTWSAMVDLVQNGAQRPYANFQYNAALDLVDMAYVEAHPRSANTSVWHVTIDSAGNVRKTDGTLIKNVITNVGPFAYNLGSRVFAYTFADGHSWAWDVSRPPSDPTKVAIAFVRFPNAVLGNADTYHDHRYCYGYWNGSTWTWTNIVAGGDTIYAGEEQYSGGVFLSKSDPSVVYAAVQATGYQYWRIRKYTTPDHGGTWTYTDITPGSATKNARPASPQNPEVIVGSVAEVVWFAGRYTTFSNYLTSILAYPPRPEVAVPKSLSVQVPALGGVDTTLKVYYGKTGVSDASSDLDNLSPVTTSGLYSLGAGGANT